MTAAVQTELATAHALSVCPSCGDTEFEAFYRVEASPTNANILFDSAVEARACPTGDIELCICAACGFIFNALFNPALSEYSDRYEATQGFSPTFSGFQKSLAEDLINRHDLSGKTVMEIGGGHGEFLVLLSQIGNCTGIGIDPAGDPARIADLEGSERVTLLPELYADKHAAYPVDAVVCKMTFEHIQPAAAFLRQIRKNLEDHPNAVVFFQVPESHRIFRDGAFEDIYYEHCSYFTPGSLARLFRRCGFSVTHIARQYSDQYLIIEARAADNPESILFPIEEAQTELTRDIKAFAAQIQAIKQSWQDRIDRVHADGGRIALWGSGAKAVGFLSTVKRDASISHIVDINPHKAGSFMPVSAHPIIAPETLTEVKPDLVIIMNPVYEKEISADISAMGLSPDIQCI